MKIRVKKIGNELKKIQKLLEKDKDVSVSVGHFEEDGKHPSGMTYPELMQLHHVGTGVGKGAIPSRPVLTILITQVERDPKKVFFGMRAVFKDGYNIEETKKLFHKIGKRMVKMERAIFGDPRLIAPNSPLTIELKGGENTPLIDTGRLRRKVKYKVEVK